MKPTKQEILDYMESHNNDEVGGNDQWDFETAEYFLLLDDKYHYKEEEAELYKKAMKILEAIDFDDSNMDFLKNAMENYCSMADIFEGYRKAIEFTLHDQFTHHAGESDLEDYKSLIKELSS